MQNDTERDGCTCRGQFVDLSFASRPSSDGETCYLPGDIIIGSLEIGGCPQYGCTIERASVFLQGNNTAIDERMSSDVRKGKSRVWAGNDREIKTIQYNVRDFSNCMSKGRFI